MINRMLERVAIVSVEWDVVDLLDSLSDQFELIGFLDHCAQKEIDGVQVIGTDEAWPVIRAGDDSLKVVLAIDPPALRVKLFNHYRDSIVSVVSKRSYVSKRASIGAGVLIQHGVTVMPRAQIGSGCKINVNATIHHDAVIGNFSTVAPGAQILGNVRIGSASYIGAGAIIRQRVEIGDECVIGAGAVVVKDLKPGSMAVGVPADRML